MTATNSHIPPAWDIMSKLPRFEVTVEEKHINEGIPNDCLYCALALAISDAVTFDDDIKVHTEMTDFDPSNEDAPVYLHGDRLQTWIKVYDASENFKASPITVEVDNRKRRLEILHPTDDSYIHAVKYNE